MSETSMAQRKAQEGLRLLKEAVVTLLKENPSGLRNVDVARELDIHSDYKGTNKDYLSWSILGLLLGEDVVVRRGLLYALPRNPKREKQKSQ